jgi:DNA-binding CsgD family transcriptional regulator
MSSDEESAPASDLQAAVRIAAIDRQLEVLTACQQELDAHGFSLASIHIDGVIEMLRAQRVELAMLR